MENILLNFKDGDQFNVDSEGNNILMRLIIEDSDERIIIFRIITSFLFSKKFNLNHTNIYGKNIINLIEEKYPDDEISQIMIRRISNIDKKDLYIPNFKEYKEQDFMAKKRYAKGSYGDVFRAFLSEELVTIKSSKYDKNFSSDLFKEMYICKNLNSDKFINFKGISKGPLGISIVSDHYEYNSSFIFIQSSYFNFEIRKEILMDLFAQILDAIFYLNCAGYCHIDLKPENIMVTSNLKVKLIDFGISVNIGLIPYFENCGGGTLNIRPPENPNYEFLYLDNDFPIFQKSADENFNYSYDMFSFACFFTSTILIHKNKHSIQLLFMKNKTYMFERWKNRQENIQELDEEDMQLLENFSPFLVDFLQQCFVIDPEDRITAKRALKHPLFSNDNPKRKNYYSVTDVSVNLYTEDIYSSSDIRNRKNKLEYMDEFYSFYSDFKIPESQTYIHLADINTDYDLKLNSICIFSDLRAVNCLRNLTTSEFLSDSIDPNIKIQMLKSNYKYIPFRSMIIAYVCKLRDEGLNSEKISLFHNLCYRELANYICNSRNYSVSISEFLNRFFNSI